MILVLGNFAGVFSNLLKLLNWSIKCKENDKILFYYTNKPDNNNYHVLPFQNYIEERNRIFFYKYFEYPSGCSSDSFLKADKFEMGFPEIPTEELPLFLQPYTNGFIACSADLFRNQQLPMIREFYHSHIQKRLVFTPLMKEFLDRDLCILRGLQQEGKRIAAVFIRWTKHFGSYDIECLFEEIDKVAKDYDYVLPITQIGPFFEKAQKHLGEKCINFPRQYLPDNIDWCRPMTDQEYEDEFRSAIRDVYLASQCDMVVGGSSNLFLGALFWNPSVAFKVFDELAHKNGG